MFFVESEKDIELLASATSFFSFPEGDMASQTSIFSHSAMPACADSLAQQVSFWPAKSFRILNTSQWCFLNSQCCNKIWLVRLVHWTGWRIFMFLIGWQSRRAAISVWLFLWWRTVNLWRLKCCLRLILKCLLLFRSIFQRQLLVTIGSTVNQDDSSISSLCSELGKHQLRFTFLFQSVRLIELVQITATTTEVILHEDLLDLRANHPQVLEQSLLFHRLN